MESIGYHFSTGDENNTVPAAAETMDYFSIVPHDSTPPAPHHMPATSQIEQEMSLTEVLNMSDAEWAATLEAQQHHQTFPEPQTQPDPLLFDNIQQLHQATQLPTWEVPGFDTGSYIPTPSPAPPIPIPTPYHHLTTDDILPRRSPATQVRNRSISMGAQDVPRRPCPPHTANQNQLMLSTTYDIPPQYLDNLPSPSPTVSGLVSPMQSLSLQYPMGMVGGRSGMVMNQPQMRMSPRIGHVEQNEMVSPIVASAMPNPTTRRPRANTLPGSWAPPNLSPSSSPKSSPTIIPPRHASPISRTRSPSNPKKPTLQSLHLPKHVPYPLKSPHALNRLNLSSNLKSSPRSTPSYPHTASPLATTTSPLAPQSPIPITPTTPTLIKPAPLLLPLPPNPRKPPITLTPSAHYAKLDAELLSTDFSDITVSALKDLLRARQLPSSGKKAVLVQRLVDEIELIKKRAEGKLKPEDDPRHPVYHQMKMVRCLEGLRRVGGLATGNAVPVLGRPRSVSDLGVRPPAGLMGQSMPVLMGQAQQPPTSIYALQDPNQVIRCGTESAPPIDVNYTTGMQLSLEMGEQPYYHDGELTPVYSTPTPFSANDSTDAPF